MPEYEARLKKFADLRRRAEELLHQRGELRESDFAESYQRLLTELDVYHAELETQNEEVRGAQHRMQESRDRYADLFRSAPVGYILVGSSGIISQCNAVAAELLGSSIKNLVGRPLVAFVHADDLSTFTEYRTYLLDGTGRHSFEVRLKRGDGEVRHVQMSSLSEQNEVSGEAQTLMSITDITPLKQQQLELTEAHRQTRIALAESESQYQLLVENANEGIVVTQQGRLKFVNAAISRLLQVPVEDLQNAPLDQFMHDDDREMVVGYHQVRLQGQPAPDHYEFRLIDGNGTAHWMTNTVVMIDWQGEPAALNFLTDITERKEAETQLAAQKQMLQKIMDNIPVMITVYNSEGQVISINSETERRLGWTEAEFKEINALEACYPDPQARAETLKFMQEAPAEWRDFSICTKSGEQFDSSWYNVKLVDGLHIGIGIDISERKKAEQNSREARDQLAIERGALQNKNIALQELIEQFENQREVIHKNILDNFEETAMPLIRRLIETSSGHMKSNLELLRSELESISSPFLTRLKSRMPTLSVRQREVCRLIKSGMSTKEVASALNISDATAQKHRELIRKKMGLHGSKVNLESYLQSLEDE